MAQIIFDVPDDKLTRLIDAFAKVYGFVPGQGVIRAQFAKGKIRDYIKEIMVRAEGLEAQRAALKDVQDNIDAIPIL